MQDDTSLIPLEAQPDFSYWAKMPHWTAWDTAALFLRLDPSFVKSLSVGLGGDELQSWQKKLRPTYNKLQKRLERLREVGEFGKPSVATGDGHMRLPPVVPSAWVNWAANNDVVCPKELLDALEGSRLQPEEIPNELPQRREDTLLRIIGATLEHIQNATHLSQAKIIEDVVDLHGHKPGISKSTLENVFADAKQRLDKW